MQDRKHLGQAMLALGALGVVLGDIGTSPLCTLQTVFSRPADRRVPVDATAVYGSISLVFWAIVTVVTLKYVVFVMRSDNDGEGGILSLIALLVRRARGRHKAWLTGLIALRVPMVLLACIATVIASHAVISGAFSVTRQAVQLGYLTRLRIIHASDVHGQMYVPFVNWLLFTAVLILVFAFQRSEKLASAYGIEVTGTITITLVLLLVLSRVWGGRRVWQGRARGSAARLPWTPSTTSSCRGSARCCSALRSRYERT